MANEMPNPADFTGLSRKVLEYSTAFSALVGRAKTSPLTPADWGPFEQLVDTASFVREGVFAGAKAEVIDWPTYQSYITQYGGYSDWEGTLRHITENPGRVVLELEERNTRDGVTDVSKTVTIYEFDDAGKIRHLDVYVMPLA